MLIRPGSPGFSNSGVGGGGVSDPNFASVVLGLHLDNNLTDVSNTPHTPTGSNHAFSTTAKFGTHSLSLVEASSAYVDVPNSADFDMAGGSFTVECFIKTAESGSNGQLMGNWDWENSARSWNLAYYNSSALLEFHLNNTGLGAGTVVSTAVTDINDDAWHHVAAVRDGDTARLFVDGTQKDSAAHTGTLYSAQTLRIGAYKHSTTPGDFLDGLLDDIRITKGVARYTANFTAPAAAFPDS